MIRACIKHLIFLLTLLFGCFHSTGEVSSSFSTLIEPSISDSIKEKSEAPLEIYDLNLYNYSILFIKSIDAYTSILTPYKYSTVDTNVPNFVANFLLDSYDVNDSYKEDSDYVSLPDEVDSSPHTKGYVYTPTPQITSIDFSTPTYKSPQKEIKYSQRDTETTASYQDWKTPNVEYTRIDSQLRPRYLGPDDKLGESESSITNRITSIVMWIYYDFPRALLKFFLKNPLYAFFLLIISAILLIVMIAGIRLMLGRH